MKRFIITFKKKLKDVDWKDAIRSIPLDKKYVTVCSADGMTFSVYNTVLIHGSEIFKNVLKRTVPENDTFKLAAPGVVIQNLISYLENGHIEIEEKHFKTVVKFALLYKVKGFPKTLKINVKKYENVETDNDYEDIRGFDDYGTVCFVGDTKIKLSNKNI